MLPNTSVISPPLPSVPCAPVRSRRIGRPTGKAKGGQASWVRRLLSSGRIREAYAYATAHKLLPLLAGVPLPAAMPPGGEGVTDGGGDNYNYKSTQEVRILQSGGKLTLGVAAIREVAGAIALAEEAGLAGGAAASGGSCAAQETAQELHSPGGELEGNRQFGQANREAEKTAYASSWGESRWVEEGEAIVGKVCRNKQYNELRLPGKDGGSGGELWTKVANWDWRNGLVRGERVWVKRTWLSADDTDSEYVVVRRMDVNEGVEAEPVAEVVAAPEREPVAVAAAATDATDTSHVLPQFLKQDTVFPRKPESAEDYILRIREEAAQWANGAGA